MADAEFEADVRLRRVLEARVFDLTSDLICGEERSVSDECFGEASDMGVLC